MPLLGAPAHGRILPVLPDLASTSLGPLVCAAQVVPDVSPGFNVPDFYAQFVEQRKAEVSERVAHVKAARGQTASR